MGHFREVLLGVLVCGLSGCQCNPSVFDPPGEGTVRLYLELDSLGEVNIAALSLQLERLDVVVLTPDEGELVTTVLDGPLVVDRGAAVVGIPLLVAQFLAPAGELEQIRLTVSSAAARTKDGREAVELSAVRDVTVPSGPQTGVKLVFRDSVVIPDGGVVSTVGFLDLGRDLVQQGNGRLLLKPSLEARELERPTIHDDMNPDEVLLSVISTEFPPQACGSSEPRCWTSRPSSAGASCWMRRPGCRHRSPRRVASTKLSGARRTGR